MDHTVEEAAEILLQNNSDAPVVDTSGEIKGVITKNDLFKAMMSLSGLSHRGVQFEFVLQDEARSIKEVTDVIRRHGARLVSILSSMNWPLKDIVMFILGHSISFAKNCSV